MQEKWYLEGGETKDISVMQKIGSRESFKMLTRDNSRNIPTV